MDILLTVDNNYFEACLVLINLLFEHNKNYININLMYTRVGYKKFNNGMSDKNLAKLSEFVSK